MQLLTQKYFEGQEANRPPVAHRPSSVVTAGVIWLVLGVFGFCTCFLNFVGSANGSSNIAPCFGFVFPLILIRDGYRAARGTSQSLLGDAIFSFILAAIPLFTAVAVASVAPRAMGLEPVLCAILLLLSATFTTAGVLALKGRKEYYRWQDRHEDRGERSRPQRARPVHRSEEEGEIVSLQVVPPNRDRRRS